LLSVEAFQLFLAVSVLTMLLTPFLIELSPRIARRAEAIQRLHHWTRPKSQPEVPVVRLRDHTIIAGYGINGRNLAQVLRETEIPFVIVEMDGRVVERESARGISIYFGDASHPQTLRRLGIQEARALVLAISDPLATRQTIKVARQLNPNIHIISRTRYLREIDDLRALGADQVVPEEFETSIEIFCLVLQEYRVPSGMIAAKAERIRKEGYAVLRRRQAKWKEIVTERIDDRYVDD
jgi:monovalent cation:H+ antiporter-2, CPA2 family